MKIDGSSLFPKENQVRNQNTKTSSSDGKVRISEALKSALLSMGTTELSGELSVEEKLVQILNNASLENNEANADLVQALLKNQMPINKEMLSTLNMYTKRFPEADIDHILFLMKNDLVVSKESLQFVKELMNQQVTLSEPIHNLSQELADAVDTPTGTKMVETLLKENSDASLVFNKVKEVLLKISPSEIISKFMTKEIGATKEVMAPKESMTSAKNVVTRDVMVAAESVVATDPVLLKESIETTAVKSATIPTQEILSTDTQEIPLLRVMDEGSIKEISKMVKTQDALIVSGVKELFQRISEMDLPDAIRDSTHKALAHKITFALLKKELTISESDLKENEGIRNFYQKLYHKVVDLLKLNVDDPFQEFAKLTKEASQLKNNLEMMNSLQQNYQFMHMPLFLHQKDVNAQLYVMNRKGRAQKEGETVTVLLRLDFRNLKQMDIYVKKAKDQVEMTFYVENENTLSDIKENSIKLHKALLDKAFHVVGLFVQLKNEEFEIKEDFLNAKSGQGIQPSFTFDAKA